MNRSFAPFGFRTAVLGLLAGISTQAQSPVRVLFWGGTNASTHNARALRDTLAPVFAANNLILNYREASSHSWLQPDSLANYDVAFLYTTDQNGTDLSQAQLDNFKAWIATGHAAVAFHGSTNTYLNNGAVSSAWGNFLGGLFLDHGNGSSDNGGTITYRDPVHASLANTSPPPPSAAATGGSPYWDEGRRHKTFTSDTVVLARSRMNAMDTATPWIWVRPQGLGWVYYNASGHDGQSWTRPEFKAQVVQALKWGAGTGATGLRGRAALAPLIRLHGKEMPISSPGSNARIIYNLSGRALFSTQDPQFGCYNLSGIAPGAYTFKVLSGSRAYPGPYQKNP
jgi:type 1 glutamine amidotransferase